jgi:hypothetical protein
MSAAHHCLARWSALVAVCAGLLASVAGCVSVPVSVSNPIPGLTTVAVAPFFNLSNEPTVDGRRFAEAYYAELQKTAGFQVIPVGVVEEALRGNGLSLEDPADTLELCRVLGADAIVVGAVTEYKPYYPPQVGLQVQWYSARNWTFYPGLMPRQGEPPGPAAPSEVCPPAIIRGQSVDDLSDEEIEALLDPDAMPLQLVQAQGGGGGKGNAASNAPNLWPQRDRGRRATGGTSTGLAASNSDRSGPRAAGRTASDAGPAATDLGPPLTVQPLMSYTRFFDGADPTLVKSLKAYRTHRGDMRSGGWEAYLHRSDDYLRFTAYLMIVEMLQLHGGELTTESVFQGWKN